VIANGGNDVLVSAASAWEIATKVRLGRLPTAVELAHNFTAYLNQQRFRQLEISIEHASRAGLLEGKHRDPFDRMLIAQAQLEKASLVSNDTALEGFGIARLW
jgi:PIN domain nuclease of toxin-antitoxin system